MRTLPLCFLLVAILMILTTACHAGDIEPTKTYENVEQRRIEDAIIQERKNLRQEREELSLREKELKTLEESVDKKLVDMDSKLEELNKLQVRIELLLKKKSTEERKRLKNLATIFERMSPEKAALALAELDDKLAADLLASMKTKAAARILDQTSIQKTTELSTTFTTLQLE
ncbi:MAG: MotE family protein [Desulforhopalus sp.]